MCILVWVSSISIERQCYFQYSKSSNSFMANFREAFAKGEGTEFVLSRQKSFLVMSDIYPRPVKCSYFC